MPSETPRRHLICYDSPSDRRRSALHRLLSGYGMWVQFSVFECVVSSGELRRLMREVDAIIDAPADKVQVFRCAAIGQPRHPGMLVNADNRHDYWLT